MIELYVIVEMCWFGNEIDNVIVMWIAIEKWLWMTCFGIWLICVVVENDVIVEDDELRNEILNDVDDERMSWAIEIVEIEICWIEIELMKNMNCLCLMVMSWLF